MQGSPDPDPNPDTLIQLSGSNSRKKMSVFRKLRSRSTRGIITLVILLAVSGIMQVANRHVLSIKGGTRLEFEKIIRFKDYGPRPTDSLDQIIKLQTICQRKLRMGSNGDGGWDLCDDVDVLPRKHCVIYSFGINNDFTVDDDIAKDYGCHVYSFDPSKSVPTHNRSTHVHYYKIGLSYKTTVTENFWHLMTFADIRKMIGHEKTQIDVVKMDIEYGDGWEALEQMLEVGELDNVKQLYLEFHLWGSEDFPPYIRLLQRLQKQGFLVFYTHTAPVIYSTYLDYPGSTDSTGSTLTLYKVHYVKRP